MQQSELKQQAAIAALSYIPENVIIGVGTGSTVQYFIEALASIKDKIQGTVASSKITEAQLKSRGIPVLEFNTVSELPLYIDGADACNPYRQLIKGAGGAVTREKILATAAERFICIVDEGKQKKIFSDISVAIEVIPMARSFVAREIVKMGGNPVYRQNFITDNGNIVLDVQNWLLAEPIKMERSLNNIPGVVCNGIFADRTADLVLIATQKGILIN